MDTIISLLMCITRRWFIYNFCNRVNI